MPHSRRDYFSEPLPSTGHPLGFIAQICIALNGLAFGAFVGLFVGGCIAYEIVPWIIGRQLSDPTGLSIAMIGVTIGMVGGLWIAGWLLHRLSEKGVSFILIALGFLPVIGVFFHVGAGLSEAWMRVRRSRRAGPYSEHGDTIDSHVDDDVDSEFDDDELESEWDDEADAPRRVP